MMRLSNVLCLFVFSASQDMFSHAYTHTHCTEIMIHTKHTACAISLRMFCLQWKMYGVYWCREPPIIICIRKKPCPARPPQPFRILGSKPRTKWWKPNALPNEQIRQSCYTVKMDLSYFELFAAALEYSVSYYFHCY